MALISVVMPIKSWQNHATAAINSILRQSYEQLELILVTGADHKFVCEQLPKDDRILSMQRSKPGIVSALNTGLSMASGEFVARMDADDIAHPDRLRLQLQHMLENPDIDVCGTSIEFFSDTDTIANGNKRYQTWLNQTVTHTDIHQQLFIESPIPHPTWMAQADVWNKVGQYLEFDGPEDYEWLLRAWLLGMRFGKVTTRKATNNTGTGCFSESASLLKWREHASRLTYTDPRYSRKAFIELKARVLSDARSTLRLNSDRGVWIAGTGRNARYWCDALQSCQVAVRGFVELDSQSKSTSKRHLPVITYRQLIDKRNDELIITAITNSEARQDLVNWFEQHELIVYKDYVLGG